jgi:hypothetical protein
MTTHRNGTGAPDALPDISRLDRARFVREAQRLRAEQIDRLLQTAARGIARLWRAATPRDEGRLSSAHRS